MYRIQQLLTMTILLAGCTGPAVQPDSPDASARTDVLVSGRHLVRVSYEQLGLEGAVPSRDLQVSNGGEPYPHYVNDGGNGRFGAGDWIEFVSDHVAGTGSRRSEYTRFNVYRVELDERRAPVRLNSSEPAAVAQREDNAQLRLRLEEDKLRVRFPGRPQQEDPEIWYWSRISYVEPFSHEIELSGGGAEPLSLRAGLRGWSRQRGRGERPADHVVHAYVNGIRVGEASWDGQEEFILDIPSMPPGILTAGPNEISLRVPERELDGQPLIDVSLVNWLEISHHYDGSLMDGISQLHPQTGGMLVQSQSEPLVVLTRDRRYVLPATPSPAWFDIPAAGEPVIVARESAARPPDGVRRDTPSRLLATDQQADYLMIAHASLIESSRPLAEFRKSQGHAVALIDVQDIYDEFSHGITSPVAIRDFIHHAYTQWQPPAPRWVLLAGDASWDVYNEELVDRNYADWTFRGTQDLRWFVKNGSTSYDQLDRPRQLVPAWQVETSEGYAASDNGFVDVVGDDGSPDLAIGRIPVSAPEEMQAVAAKIIEYEQGNEVGPWRSKLLWVSNEELRYQQISDHLAATRETEGLSSGHIYPSRAEADNRVHQERLIGAFDEGQLLVHFMGHGGRYIWRTGPPDIRKNHDLFTLDHLEQLSPTTRLPLVMSMTCYSAPFDHPTADSIGEKFLRMPDRGAVGVFAASWRNSPSRVFSDRVISELMKPGQTVGEAIMLAKRDTRSRIMVDTYNYLGDPATRLALPSHRVDLDARVAPDVSQLSSNAAVLSGFGPAEVLIEWLSPERQVLRTERTRLAAGRLKHQGEGWPNASRPTAVRAYIWNTQQNIDAVAYTTLDPLGTELADATE